MLAKHRIPGLQVAWLLALMMITAIAVSPAYAAGVHQEVTDQPIMAFDGSLVNEYMAECQSVAAGSPVSCMDYAFSLAGVDTLAAMPVHLEQFALNVAEVDAFDGSLVNEYMAECQSVAAGSPVNCMDYAFSLAGADALAAMPVHLEQFALNVAEVDAFDGSLVNEYMAECQSVIAGSVVECMDYAVELAAPFAE